MAALALAAIVACSRDAGVAEAIDLPAAPAWERPTAPPRYFFEPERATPAPPHDIHHTGIAADLGGGPAEPARIAWPTGDLPPGEYAAWVLAAARDYRPEAPPNRFRLVAGGGEAVAVEGHRGRALRWTRAEGALRIDGDADSLALEVADAPTRPVVESVLLVPADAAFAPRGRELDLDVRLPPVWAFGVLYGGYTDQARSAARVDSLLARGFPVGGYWVDSWFWDFAREGDGPGGYLDFRGDRGAFPDVAALWGDWEERGVKAGVWVWNSILRAGNEATHDDFADRGFFDTVFVNTNGWHNELRNTVDGEVDFGNPAAAAYWVERLDSLFAAGLDFLKLDRSADTAFTRVAHAATAERGRASAGRGYVQAHIHNVDQAAVARYPAKWTGDAKTAWTQPDYPNLGNYSMGAYRENVAMVADSRLAMYGVPLLAHDLGGYAAFGARERGPELYTRWAQFAALTPIVTVFAAADNPTGNMPYNFGAAAEASARRYLRLHAELLPYVYTLAHEARATGVKPVRDTDTGRDDQFLLGPSLLVAPVVDSGARARVVALPPGRWVDFDTGAPVGEGPAEVTVDAPLERLPLLARAGAVVPLKPFAANVDAAAYDSLRLVAFPGDGAAVLVEDDGASEDYLRGATSRTDLRMAAAPAGLRLRVEAARGTFDGAPARRHLALEVRGVDAPGGPVTVGGEPLAAGAVAYDPDARRLALDLGERDRAVAVEVFVPKTPSP